MKDNTQRAKEFLQQAIRAMPDDFALSEARAHLKLALQKIENVAQKRDRRELQLKENEAIARQKELIQKQNLGLVPGSLKATLDLIDEMIADEHAKINVLREKRDSGDDDIQTILG